MSGVSGCSIRGIALSVVRLEDVGWEGQGLQSACNGIQVGAVMWN